MQVKKRYFGTCNSALDYFSRGNFKKLIKDYDGALNDFNDAIELRPLFWEAYFQRGKILSLMQRDSEADSDFNKSIELIIKYY